MYKVFVCIAETKWPNLYIVTWFSKLRTVFVFLPSCTVANKMLLLFINIFFIEKTKYMLTYCNLIVLF